MSFKSIVRERIGSMSRRVGEGKHWRSRNYRSQTSIAPDEASHLPANLVVVDERSCWTNLPPELLLDILKRVEESETLWPARAVVVSCASVCKSWRRIINEIVKTPEQCGRITFPISLKQPGPRESPIQCFIRRDRANLTYSLYLGLVPSEGHRDKSLLAAKRIRRATGTDFVVSLAADGYSRASSNYVGKLRSNFLGTKFTIYDSQPTSNTPAALPHNRSSRRFNSKQVSPRVPACNYSVGSVSYELNVLRTRGPRRLHCVMHSIPFSSMKEGGAAFTPTSFPHPFSEQLCSPSPSAKGQKADVDATEEEEEPLALKNKAPRWHEQLQCWCLNFRGRVTVASVKNFQLVAHGAERERVILQFGKIGKDIFTMDYAYPLSAFQAFAICLTTFDTKPACE